MPLASTELAAVPAAVSVEPALPQTVLDLAEWPRRVGELTVLKWKSPKP